MKKTAKILGWVVLVLVVILLGMEFFGGYAIKHSVNAVGPRVLGVPVSLKHAAFSPFRGRVTLKGMLVGNPEGFNTPSLFNLGLLDIDLDMSSLLKKVIVVTDVRIEAPEITFEKSLKTSNIGALMDQLSGDKPAEKPDETAPETQKKPAEKKAGKKVVIRKLTIADAQVNVSMTALGGHSLVLPLPTIQMTDIGGTGSDDEGVSFMEAIRDVLGAVFKSVSDVVTGAGKLAVDGAKAVGGAAADGAKAVGGAATDGAKAVAGAAADGAKAVGEGAGKLFDAATGVFDGK